MSKRENPSDRGARSTRKGEREGHRERPSERSRDEQKESSLVPTDEEDITADRDVEVFASFDVMGLKEDLLRGIYSYGIFVMNDLRCFHCFWWGNISESIYLIII